MAMAYKCDRCKSLFDRRFVPDITVHGYIHGQGVERYDLCPKCQEYLENWLKEFKEKSV